MSNNCYRLSLLLLLSLAWLVPPTSAQQKADPGAAQALQAHSDDPSLVDGLLSSLSGASIEAGENNNQARFRISSNRGQRSWSLTVSTPIDKDAGFTALADLDGLAGALTAAFGLSKTFLPTLSREELREIVKAQDAICRRLGLDPEEGQCDDNQVLAAGTRRDHKEFLWQTLGRRRPSILWLEGKVGRQTNRFLDPLSLARADRREYPYSLSVGYGSLGLRSLLSVKLRYQEAFRDAPKATHCTPFAADDRLEDCQTLPFGEPVKQEGLVLTVGARIFFKRTAIDPMAAYDSEEEVIGLALPWYFLRNQDGQLTGGIRLGWRSDQDEVNASVFVAKSLSLGF